jgi:hypothetical protein
MIYEYGEPQWNDDRGKPKNLEKTCPSATVSTTNPTWADLDANTGLHGEMLATNHQNHFMVQTVFRICLNSQLTL